MVSLSQEDSGLGALGLRRGAGLGAAAGAAEWEILVTDERRLSCLTPHTGVSSLSHLHDFSVSLRLSKRLSAVTVLSVSVAGVRLRCVSHSSLSAAYHSVSRLG